MNHISFTPETLDYNLYSLAYETKAVKRKVVGHFPEGGQKLTNWKAIELKEG